MNTKAYFGKFGGQFVPETVMFGTFLEGGHSAIVDSAEVRTKRPSHAINPGAMF